MMLMSWLIFLLRDCRAADVLSYVASAPMLIVAKSGFTLTSAFPDTLTVFLSQQSWASEADTNNAINNNVLISIKFL